MNFQAQKKGVGDKMAKKKESGKVKRCQGGEGRLRWKKSLRESERVKEKG